MNNVFFKSRPRTGTSADLNRYFYCTPSKLQFFELDILFKFWYNRFYDHCSRKGIRVHQWIKYKLIRRQEHKTLEVFGYSKFYYMAGRSISKMKHFDWSASGWKHTVPTVHKFYRCLPKKDPKINEYRKNMVRLMTFICYLERIEPIFSY